MGVFKILHPSVIIQIFNSIADGHLRFERGQTTKDPDICESFITPHTFQYKLSESYTGNLFFGLIKCNERHWQEVIDGSKSHTRVKSPLKVWTNSSKGEFKTVTLDYNGLKVHGQFLKINDEKLINIQFLIIPKEDKSSNKFP